MWLLFVAFHSFRLALLAAREVLAVFPTLSLGTLIRDRPGQDRYRWFHGDYICGSVASVSYNSVAAGGDCVCGFRSWNLLLALDLRSAD
jgi:hypothetical protein